ncbi:unnamed protein product [Ambrosiozyma monospora]|uniref:Unnamed protein product n=1 Tax=Ambrosiozyma monospora TaxID=43982 RepID=A0A9W6Z0B7_AMBMO|nr:unnamed protein product [Ambrosiozyma monospora]
MPVNDIATSTQSLQEEIDLALKSLSVHMFTLYTKGHFQHFKKLVELFEELDHVRINFEKHLLTTSEVKSAKKKVAHLLTMLSKIVASANSTSGKKSKDVSGFESILARDEVTGELYNPSPKDFKDTLINPAKIAQNQMFFALYPNFPVEHSNIPLYPERSKKFDQAIPSHVLLDFKSVWGRSKKTPKGFVNMTAYMYLRNSKKRLTEGFGVPIRTNRSGGIQLNQLSAALFKNIPASEIDAGRIYLVAVLVETVQIDNGGSSTNDVPNLKSIRKGVAAGAVDVSRVFSRRKGHWKNASTHKFTMKLYGSFMTPESDMPLHFHGGMNPLMAMSMCCHQSSC